MAFRCPWLAIFSFVLDLDVNNSLGFFYLYSYKLDILYFVLYHFGRKWVYLYSIIVEVLHRLN